MIPKIIHYCWFGKKEINKTLKKYIRSWKDKLPDYKFICWNENNYDVNKYAFTREAYEKKKYAFVSDMVRLEVLYTYGGVYLDTDVELLSSLNQFLNNELILGYESPNEIILATSLIGAASNNEFIKHLFEIYTQKKFIRSDGSFNDVPNTIILTDEFQKFYKIQLLNNGEITLINKAVSVFPMEYFHPLDLLSGKIYITSNTIAIHWHSLLWVSKKTKVVKFIRQRILIPLIGEEKYKKFVQGMKK